MNRFPLSAFRFLVLLPLLTQEARGQSPGQVLDAELVALRAQAAALEQLGAAVPILEVQGQALTQRVDAIEAALDATRGEVDAAEEKSRQVELTLTGQVDALAAAVAAIPESFGTVVPWFDRDMTVDLQNAFAYQLKTGLPTLCKGKRYKVTAPLKLPSVWGFAWHFPASSIEGTIHPNQTGIGGAVVWAGPVDSPGPIVEGTCANGRFNVCLLGRERDNQPVPPNLVGWAWRRPVVPAGKSQFGFFRAGDMKIGMQCGAPGDVKGHHCDCLDFGHLEFNNIASAWESNNEQSMGNHAQTVVLSDVERFIDVWAGGAFTADAVTVLGPCTALTIRKAIEANDPEGRAPRPVSVGSGNGIFTLNNIKCDRQTDGEFRLLDMERDAGVEVNCSGLILPGGATLLVNAKGNASVSIDKARGVSAGSIRLAGVRRKNTQGTADTADDVYEWIRSNCTIDKSRTADTAKLLTDDSIHGTLLTPHCWGGFTNDVWPNKEVRR